MKRQGCSLRLLPLQRATSVMAPSSALVTRLVVKSRICRTRMSGLTVLRGVDAPTMGPTDFPAGVVCFGMGCSFQERGRELDAGTIRQSGEPQS